MIIDGILLFTIFILILVAFFTYTCTGGKFNTEDWDKEKCLKLPEEDTGTSPSPGPSPTPVVPTFLGWQPGSRSGSDPVGPSSPAPAPAPGPGPGSGSGPVGPPSTAPAPAPGPGSGSGSSNRGVRPDEGIYSITFTDYSGNTYYASRRGNDEEMIFYSKSKGLDSKSLWYVKHVADLQNTRGEYVPSDEITLHKLPQIDGGVCKSDNGGYIKCKNITGNALKFKTIPHSTTPDLYLLKLVTSDSVKVCRVISVGQDTSAGLPSNMKCDDFASNYVKFTPEKYLFVKSRTLNDPIYDISGGSYNNTSLNNCINMCNASDDCKGFNVNYADELNMNTNVNCNLKTENRLDKTTSSPSGSFAYKGTYFPEVKSVDTLISCKENDPNPDSGYIYKIIGAKDINVTSGHIQAYDTLEALQSYYPSPDDWNNVSNIDCKNRVDTGTRYPMFNQNCLGEWKTTSTNYNTCQWSRKYEVTQEKRGNGDACDYEDGKQELNKPLTSQEIREDIQPADRGKCESRSNYPCGSTYVYKTISTDKVTRQACNNGVKANASGNTTTLTCSRNRCPSTGGGFGR